MSTEWRRMTQVSLPVRKRDLLDHVGYFYAYEVNFIPVKVL